LRPMFDWPENIHTSPTSTSLMVIVLFPLMVSVCGKVFTASGSSTTCHWPFWSATTVLFCPAKLTVTISPGSAVPQTGAPWTQTRVGEVTKVVFRLTPVSTVTRRTPGGRLIYTNMRKMCPRPNSSEIKTNRRQRPYKCTGESGQNLLSRHQVFANTSSTNQKEKKFINMQTNCP
jgi:hypothetical protein